VSRAGRDIFTEEVLKIPWLIKEETEFLKDSLPLARLKTERTGQSTMVTLETELDVEEERKKLLKKISK